MSLWSRVQWRVVVLLHLLLMKQLIMFDTHTTLDVGTQLQTDSATTAHGIGASATLNITRTCGTVNLLALMITDTCWTFGSGKKICWFQGVTVGSL